MHRAHTVVTVLFVSLFLFLIAAPAFAEDPWIFGPGKKGGNHTLSEFPWSEDPGKKGANHTPSEFPWIDGKGKGGANHTPSEWPWVDGKGNGGANHNASAIAFLQFCWRMFYR